MSHLIKILWLCCLSSLGVAHALTLEQATTQIIQSTSNKVLGAKVGDFNGQRIYIIKILTPKGRVQHIKVDAVTGGVVR